MVKILNILSDTNIGGAGRSVMNYLEYMDRDRFEASAIVPGGSRLIAPFKALGVAVVEVDFMRDRSFDLSAVRPLERIIGECRPDIVHTHGSLSGRIAAKNRGVPVVFTRHSAFPFSQKVTRTPLKYVYRYLYDHYSDRIIAISRAGLDTLRPLGIPEDKVVVMMNGVAPVSRTPKEECRSFRGSLGIGEDDFVAVMVARVEEYKGHRDVLDAVALLRSRGRRVKLVIAGTGSYEEEAKRRARELGIWEDTVFLGFQRDVAPVLSIADVQVNASYVSETSSLSVLEGLSMGLPAVLSDCCGNPDLVENGVSGLLFPPRDSRELADKLMLLMDDRERLEEMGRQSERIYLERFTGASYAAGIEKVYLDILEEKNEKGK